MRPVQPTTTQPTNRMGRRPGMMAARRNAGPSPTVSTPVQSQPATGTLESLSQPTTSTPTATSQSTETALAGPVLVQNPEHGYKKGGKVKGYKNGGCVMGKRGVRNTKMF